MPEEQVRSPLRGDLLLRAFPDIADTALRNIGNAINGAVVGAGNPRHLPTAENE